MSNQASQTLSNTPRPAMTSQPNAFGFGDLGSLQTFVQQLKARFPQQQQMPPQQLGMAPGLPQQLASTFHQPQQNPGYSPMNMPSQAQGSPMAYGVMGTQPAPSQLGYSPLNMPASSQGSPLATGFSRPAPQAPAVPPTTSQPVLRQRAPLDLFGGGFTR